jgi:hypothetical protein
MLLVDQPNRQGTNLARTVRGGNILTVSTVQEIELAIEQLPASEREAIESRLLARRFGLSALTEEEHANLLASLDEAERDIDRGRAFSGDQLPS